MLPRRNFGSQPSVRWCGLGALVPDPSQRSWAIFTPQGQINHSIQKTWPRRLCANVKFLYDPAGGLSGHQNCPMLTTRRFCAGSRLDEIGSFIGAGTFSSSTLGPMHRVIARTLLLALLAGLFSPLATASSMPMSHPHCMRKPVPAPAAEMSGCHHHGAVAVHSASAPENTEPASSDQVQGPNDCCQDHECCRSMARPQFAHTSLRSTHSVLTATRLISVPHVHALSFDLTRNLSARAPPLL